VPFDRGLPGAISVVRFRRSVHEPAIAGYVARRATGGALVTLF